MNLHSKTTATVIMGALLTTSLACSAIKPEIATAQVKILIPLYSYPTWYNPPTYTWPQVAAAARQVPITAIINPNNGPDNGPPNRDYARGIQDLKQGGVTILGYVATNYGKRDINQVRADIDIYAKHFQLDGIFLDEAASSSDKLDYYQNIYKHIKTQPQLQMVVLNQGTQTDQGYLTRPAGDTLVIFENYSTAWNQYQPQSYVKNYQPQHFSCLIHTVPDAATMKQHINQAVARNIQYIYVTDDSPDHPDKDPWNSLPSYWQEEINHIQSLNQKAQSPSGN
ncbi:MAG: spherulation-specific family 4 protein [Trichormus sp.]